MKSDAIEQVARQEKVISDPVVALMVMGRKRPGFDPQWGALMKRAIGERMDALPWSVVTPSDNIADEAELQRAVAGARDTGATVLVLVQPTISDGRLAVLLARLWDGPLLLWATPEKPEGAMISANSLVGTHVMAATLRQLGHPLEIVYGDPRDEEKTGASLRRSILAVHAAESIRNRKFGLVGYHAPGFVDFHADPVFISDSLGSQLYHTSTTELLQRVAAFGDAELGTERAAFQELRIPAGERFRASSDESGTEGDPLGMQARYYRAFRDLFAEERLDALAFRCWPDLPSATGHWPYLALARLVSEGFPIAMEGDVDGAICSRIAESAAMGPVYLSDWLEHDRDTITIWHTGAAPFQLCDAVDAETGPRLSTQFNNGLPTVVDATIRANQEMTIFRLWRFDNEYCMTAVEGESVAPRRHLMATNGLFHTDRVDVTEWFEEMVQNGMPHHLCIVPGHHGETLRRIARLSGFQWL